VTLSHYVTASHCVTVILCHTVSQWHSVAVSHGHSITLCHCNTVSHSVTVAQCYSVTWSQRHTATVVQCVVSQSHNQNNKTTKHTVTFTGVTVSHCHIYWCRSFTLSHLLVSQFHTVTCDWCNKTFVTEHDLYT